MIAGTVCVVYSLCRIMFSVLMFTHELRIITRCKRVLLSKWFILVKISVPFRNVQDVYQCCFLLNINSIAT